MASTRLPARTPTKTVAPKPKAKEAVMFEVVGDIDADGYVDVKIFGEPFTIDTDVNGWLLMLGGSGRARDIVNLVMSVLKVEPVDGEDIEVTRRNEEDRFNRLLGSQKHFSVEKALELVNALTEISAGNEP